MKHDEKKQSGLTVMDHLTPSTRERESGLISAGAVTDAGGAGGGGRPVFARAHQTASHSSFKGGFRSRKHLNASAAVLHPVEGIKPVKQGPRTEEGSSPTSPEENPAGCLGSVKVTRLNEVKTGDKAVNAEPRSHPPTLLHTVF